MQNARIVVAALMASAGVANAEITANFETSYDFGGMLGDQTDAFKASVNAAVMWWEMALPTIDVSIDFKIMNLGGDGSAGLAQYDKINNTTGRITEATIWLNSNTQKWFFDDTPHDDGEFDMMDTDTSPNPDTEGTINAGRRGAATDNKAMNVWDALSVIKHEIGHALGVGFNAGDPAGYMLWEDEVDADDDVDIKEMYKVLFDDDKLPILQVETDGGSHLAGDNGDELKDTLLAEGTGAFGMGERVLMSGVDILTIASLYCIDPDDVHLNPSHVPAPMTLAALGLVGIAGSRSRS